ncbi:MAG: FkbM family methyltransferase [Lacunisphaera sp.]|jgi:FkbM family methyltransferase|nr:FkbM family methyltransferase [Lacunisphaera sp.]
MLSVKQKMLIARALNRVVGGWRSSFGGSSRVRCERRQVHWDLDLDEGIDLSIYLLGAYEPRLLAAYRRLIGPGQVVWDIGANIGAHTLHFARLAGDTGRVFAFEPTDFAFAKLQANLRLNPLLQGRVHLENVFLVDHDAASAPQTVFASWPVGRPDHPVDPEHLGRPMELTTARAATGDAIAAAHGLDRLDFVKLDVDGHELAVLQGMSGTLRRFHPNLMMEIAPFVLDRHSPRALADLLALVADLGYRLRSSDSGRALPQREEELRRLIGAGGSLNVLLQR